jgi:hypothetical protein
VKLSAEERGRLEAHNSRWQKFGATGDGARILLKADVSEAGEGRSDSDISAALDTSVNNVARTRQLLVEEVRGDAEPQAQPQLCPAADIRRAAEAKLIALACSPALPGFGRWSLRLLEEKVRRIEHRREGQREYDRTDARP